MPKKYRLAAVIDIGSNELTLQIAQTAKTETSAGVIKYLEDLSYPLGLGRDTFHTGKMSFDKADKACEILKKFLQVIKEYNVRDIRTIATTAVREAANMDYILDQIKIKTGLDVEVLDDQDEKRYIHKLLTYHADWPLKQSPADWPLKQSPADTPLRQSPANEPLKQSALMVYISAGSIGVSALFDGKMPFFNNILVGSLRMGELFGDLADYTHDFYRLMEEYLASFTDQLKREMPGKLKHFIAAGQEMDIITELMGAGETGSPLFTIPRAKFMDMYHEIKQKTTDQIASYYDIDSDKADILLPALCIYQNLLALTDAEEITASRLLPCDAIIYEMLYPKTFQMIDKQFYKNTLLAAKIMAERYNCDEAHWIQVNEFAVTIYDLMKKVHGLGTGDKLLLQSAAVLHDIGKFINGNGHSWYSYEIVRGSYLPGLNKHEMEIVALICLYHSRRTPTIHDPRYYELGVDDRVRVSKLAAILRVADALDRSHNQKIKKISVKIDGEVLSVSTNTSENIALEQWAFNQKGSFFEEVFGIKAELKIKTGRKGE